SSISYPGATLTNPLAINNAGTVAGYFQEASTFESFELVGSAYELVKAQPAVDTYMYGIDSAGELVGYALTPKLSYVNLSFDHGKFQKIIIPKAPGDFVLGISPSGAALVGSYAPSGTVVGFVYRNGTLQALQLAQA